MSGTLWGGDAGLDASVDRYTVGEDRRWDARLLRWDVIGSVGHALGLRELGVLTAAEFDSLHSALRSALVLVDQGELVIGPADEDAHSTLEKHLVAELGDVGRKIHTGRSRNDQVLVDLRLYLREELAQVALLGTSMARALLAFGAAHERVLMPGFTHQRRAMPTTVAVWAGGFAEALLEDVEQLTGLLDVVDRCPLGSAAGYGAPLAIDRDLVAESLGFAAPQHMVTSAQLSRGKLETQVLHRLWAVAQDLGKLSWDVILFSSEEYGYFELPRELATGSSIMPHKQNPDIFELTRARAATLDGYVAQAAALTGKLPSGYHRDLQLTKEPLFRGLDTVREMLEMNAHALCELRVDTERCEAAVAGELLVTDEVFRRVREGTPFRTAYAEVSAAVKSGESLPVPDKAEVLAARDHRGGAGRPELSFLEDLASRLEGQVRTRSTRWREAVESLMTG